jgi:CRP/FNR family transcriptional regulator, cyclic AMP receptor protein
MKKPRPAILRRIRDVEPFSSCTDEELEVVARNTSDHHAAAGAVLTEEGRLGREWIVIVRGSAVVRVGTSEVARLGPGDVIGEVALLDRGVRTATVVAETDVEALVASAAEFDRILDRVPAVSRALVVALARRLRDADALLRPRAAGGVVPA